MEPDVDVGEDDPFDESWEEFSDGDPGLRGGGNRRSRKRKKMTEAQKKREKEREEQQEELKQIATEENIEDLRKDYIATKQKACTEADFLKLVTLTKRIKKVEKEEEKNKQPSTSDELVTDDWEPQNDTQKVMREMWINTHSKEDQARAKERWNECYEPVPSKDGVKQAPLFNNRTFGAMVADLNDKQFTEELYIVLKEREVEEKEGPEEIDLKKAGLGYEGTLYDHQNYARDVRCDVTMVIIQSWRRYALVADIPEEDVPYCLIPKGAPSHYTDFSYFGAGGDSAKFNRIFLYCVGCLPGFMNTFSDLLVANLYLSVGDTGYFLFALGFIIIVGLAEWFDYYSTRWPEDPWYLRIFSSISYTLGAGTFFEVYHDKGGNPNLLDEDGLQRMALYEALLQSTPQAALQTYVIMIKTHVMVMCDLWLEKKASQVAHLPCWKNYKILTIELASCAISLCMSSNYVVDLLRGGDKRINFLRKVDKLTALFIFMMDAVTRWWPIAFVVGVMYMENGKEVSVEGQATLGYTQMLDLAFITLLNVVPVIWLQLQLEPNRRFFDWEDNDFGFGALKEVFFSAIFLQFNNMRGLPLEMFQRLANIGYVLWIYVQIDWKYMFYAFTFYALVLVCYMTAVLGWYHLHRKSFIKLLPTNKGTFNRKVLRFYTMGMIPIIAGTFLQDSGIIVFSDNLFIKTAIKNVVYFVACWILVLVISKKLPAKYLVQMILVVALFLVVWWTLLM